MVLSHEKHGVHLVIVLNDGLREIISDPGTVDERNFCVGFTYKARRAWRKPGDDFMF